MISQAPVHRRSEEDLAPALHDVVIQINRILGVQLHDQVHGPLLGTWDQPAVKELVWILAESLLPLSLPRDQGTLIARELSGWVQIELQIEGNPFTSEELSDLIEHCKGNRFSGRHLFRKSLRQNLDKIQNVVQEQQGTLNLTSTQVAGTVFAITLPTNRSATSS